MMKCDICNTQVKKTISVMTDHPFSWLGMGVEQYCLMCFKKLMEDKDTE